MRRRHALLAAASCLIPAAGRTAPAFVTAEVAPGIHVRQGVHEEATAQNQDGIANIGFIVGDGSVAVIDPGGSRADGEALRALLHAATDRPVSHVIMTHLHPDHVFGACAFAPDRPVFVGHARMAPMLVTRGEFYRNRLADILGIEAAGDYAKPDLLVQESARIDLGGRTLTLRAHPTAHTDNDLTILDEATGTLWMGDLLFLDRVPALDGSVLGWLGVTRALRDEKARAAVPGHGPAIVSWPDAAAAQERYLSLLVREIRAIIARGGAIDEAVATVGASERPAWRLFDEYNGRNVTAAFKELEWE
ncbi:MAG TPA: quinoprotein relay system zinc metallohydrolase 2 [Acetobacteraceae bacterium]|nr:quinoprotein relay system zinc metallohydrolase 2 [Acetobacteraceae bacterium]